MSCAARTLRATFALLLVLLSAAPAFARPTSATGTEASYARAMRAINPRLRDAQSRVYANTLLTNARTFHLDPRLVMAVVTIESHWNESAVSPDGAIGLGQLKPETARRLGVDARSGRGNIIGLSRYLHRLLGMFKSSRSAIQLALASYNIGPLAVKGHGATPPSIAHPYVAKVVAMYVAFKAHLGAGTPPVRRTVADVDGPMSIAHAQTAYWTSGPSVR